MRIENALNVCIVNVIRAVTGGGTAIANGRMCGQMIIVDILNRNINARFRSRD